MEQGFSFPDDTPGEMVVTIHTGQDAEVQRLRGWLERIAEKTGLMSSGLAMDVGDMARSALGGDACATDEIFNTLVDHFEVRIAALEAERDRYKAALEEIAHTRCVSWCEAAHTATLAIVNAQLLLAALQGGPE